MKFFAVLYGLFWLAILFILGCEVGFAQSAKQKAAMVATTATDLEKYHSVWLGDQQEIDHAAREALANTRGLTVTQRDDIVYNANHRKTVRCAAIKEKAKPAVDAAVKLGNKMLADPNYTCDALGSAAAQLRAPK